LSINNLEKQALLETTDTLERIQTLRPLLQRQILEAKGPGYFRLSSDMIRDELFPN